MDARDFLHMGRCFSSVCFSFLVSHSKAPTDKKRVAEMAAGN